MSELDETIERARRLRLVIEACERMAVDPDEPLREQARRWLDRLLISDVSGYPPFSASVTSSGPGERHDTSGGRALQSDALYDGWGGDRR